MNILEYENYQEKKVHGNPLFPYITYPCSIPLDFKSVPMHWHDDMEIIYIKKGCGVVSIDLQAYDVHAGSILIVLPGHLHAIFQKGNESMEYENILFLPELIVTKKSDICNYNYLTPLFSNELYLTPFFEPTHMYYKKIASCIDLADEYCNQTPFAYEFVIKSQISMLFYYLISCCSKTPCQKEYFLQEEKIKQILLFIEENYQHKITIADAAKHLDISTSYFMKFFKSTMGSSFICYLNEYRLERVTRLLTSSDANILTIAYECGFDNISYFNRQFKKRFGISPYYYRKKYHKTLPT